MTTTAGTTSRGYRYPGDASATDVPGDLKKLADDVNTDVAAVAADGAVTTAKIADSAVTSAKIADGTIVNADVSGSAAIDPAKVAGTAVVQARTLTAGTGLTGGGSLATDRTIGIAAGGVGTTELAADAVTSAKIAAGTIVDADVSGSAAIDVSKLSGVAASATVGNLFPANVATGTDTLGDTTGFFADASTLASSTDYALVGSKSLKATMTGAAGIIYAPGANTSGTPVAAGATYTGQFALRSSAARSTFARIYWYTSGGSPISSVDAAAVNSSTSGWTVYAVTGVAPATAAYGTVIAVTSGNTVGDVHYLDSLGFWAGAGGVWALPGTPIANLGTYTDESVGRRVFTWDTVNNRWQMTYGDTGWRDVSANLDATHLTENPNAKMYLRRVNALVEWHYAQAGTGTTGSVKAVYTFPTGFAMSGSGIGTAIAYPTINAATGAMPLEGIYYPISSSGLVTASWTAINHSTGGNHVTDQSWPTALPGTAVGSIPQ